MDGMEENKIKKRHGNRSERRSEIGAARQRVGRAAVEEESCVRSRKYDLLEAMGGSAAPPERSFLQPECNFSGTTFLSEHFSCCEQEFVSSQPVVRRPSGGKSAQEILSKQKSSSLRLEANQISPVSVQPDRPVGASYDT